VSAVLALAPVEEIAEAVEAVASVVVDEFG
jgi:hypothetical protein